MLAIDYFLFVWKQNNRNAVIYSKSTSYPITLTSCIRTDCTASQKDGTVYLNGRNSLTVTDTLLQTCITKSNDDEPGGCGLYMCGSSYLSISSSTFLRCHANLKNVSRGGGGLQTYSSNNVLISSSRFFSRLTNSADADV